MTGRALLLATISWAWATGCAGPAIEAPDARSTEDSGGRDGGTDAGSDAAVAPDGDTDARVLGDGGLDAASDGALAADAADGAPSIDAAADASDGALASDAGDASPVTDAGPTGTVSGNLAFVNVSAASTSVLLVSETSWVPHAATAAVPSGTRLSPIDGAFAFTNVVPGAYVALVAFENDGLVLDPTQEALTHVVVPSTGGAVTIPMTLRVTHALPVMSPGAAGIETVTTATPTLAWGDDTGEDGFEVYVYDATGAIVASATDIPASSGSGTPSYVIAPPLPAAGRYQFHALSYRVAGARQYLSATEDLRGVFDYAP